MNKPVTCRPRRQSKTKEAVEIVQRVGNKLAELQTFLLNDMRDLRLLVKKITEPSVEEMIQDAKDNPDPYDILWRPINHLTDCEKKVEEIYLKLHADNCGLRSAEEICADFDSEVETLKKRFYRLVASQREDQRNAG